MDDLTILYYTANVILDSAAEKIRNNLLKVTENKFPVISVSQKPINFGQNICVGEIGRLKYNLYKQILTGVKEVKTKYVACAEDDTLYSMEHFMHRPESGIFSYETNMWFAGQHFFWHQSNANQRSGMWGCISETEALLKNLTARYTLFPTDPLGGGSRIIWGEPGAADKFFGLKDRLSFFESREPCVVFLHKEAMGTRQMVGRYGTPKPEDMTYNLGQFGKIGKLWQTYWI